MTDIIKNYIIAGLAGVLLLSIAGNTLLFRSRDKMKTALGQYEVSLKQARDAGESCTRSVEALEEAAKKKADAAKPGIDKAKGAVVEGQKKAQVILSTPPSKPGDDYASAVDRAINWLKGRRQ